MELLFSKQQHLTFEKTIQDFLVFPIYFRHHFINTMGTKYQRAAEEVT